MALETAAYVGALNPANPTQTDPIAEGDNHLRLIKTVLKNTFPNLSAAMTATADELNKLAGLVTTKTELGFLSGVTSAIQTQINNILNRTITANNGLTGGGNLTANRTIGLTGQALALHNLASNGLITRTAAGTVAGRTIVGGTGVTVENGDGVSGDPTINVSTIGQTAWNNGTSTLEAVISPAKLKASVEKHAPSIVAATIASFSAGDIGSYVWAKRASSEDALFGDVVAGSDLRPTSGVSGGKSFSSAATGSLNSGSALTGTWRCMGMYDSSSADLDPADGSAYTSYLYGATIWLRIA